MPCKPEAHFLVACTLACFAPSSRVFLARRCAHLARDVRARAQSQTLPSGFEGVDRHKCLCSVTVRWGDGARVRRSSATVRECDGRVRRCESATVEYDGPVRGSSAGLSDRTLGPSDSRTGPSDSRTGPSHRRTLAPSHRTISLNNDVAAFPSFIDMNVESRRLEKRTTSRRQPRCAILLGNQAIVAHAPPMVFILLIAAHEAKPTRPS